MKNDYEKRKEEFERILSQEKPSIEDISRVKSLLGRHPDGLHRVIKKEERIITVLSETFVRKKPFPTLFWLVDKDLSKKISAIESTGIIKEYEADEEITNLAKRDNQVYAKLRSLFHESLHPILSEDSPFYSTIYESGAGGIQDHKRIRCLHLHMAYHYSVGSSLGEFLVREHPQLKI